MKDQKSSVQTVHDVQLKILEIMKFIDKLCREHDVVYFIMGGTALGAVRHGGFIPWDDDLDIFMTPAEYAKFKHAFNALRSEQFVLQEWRTTPNYLEYAKVRMNGTTFIEEVFKDRKDMHHGIYVDIMMLHKVPMNTIIQKIVYYKSKFVTLYALSQRNWKPKTKGQAVMLKVLKFLPCKWIAKASYRHIYKYDSLENGSMFCYWITPARFKNGLFHDSLFANPVDIPFEDTMLMGSERIRDYLEYRYGDYTQLPSEEERKEKIHAMIFDCYKEYKVYLN